MAGPRYAKVYQIHKTRCIFCGYCEEACPVSAIFMGKDYELAVYSKDDFIWDKTELLVPAPSAALTSGSARPCQRSPVTAIPRRARRARPRLRRRDGDDAVRQGVFINRCFESLNLSEPDLVRDVHRQYLRAGADVIETNTFGANRMKLRAFGLGDRVREINARRRARSRAQRGAGGQAYVAGAIGPLGVRVEPWGKTGVDEAEAMFREQAEALPAAASTCSCSKPSAT